MNKKENNAAPPEHKIVKKILKEKANRLELIGQIGQRTTAILNQEELFSQSVTLIGNTFQYHSVNILLVEDKSIILQATTLPALKSLRGKLRIRIGEQGITGWVAKKRLPLIIPDVSQDSRYLYVKQEELKTKSEIAVPIQLKDSVIGVLDVQSTAKNAFSTIDVFTLQAIADQLAISIENAKLYAISQQEIHERKQVESALSESERRFRSLYENSILGLYRTTPDGKILMANPALVRMLGYPSFEELSKRNLETEGIETGYSRSDFKKHMQEYGQMIGLESEWTKKDRTVLYIRESATAVYNEAGQISYYDGTVEDITDQKRLEKKLQQAQKMEAVGRLAGGIAHDFNNLIMVIQGYSELILNGLDKNNPYFQNIQQIHKAAERAGSLTQQLLAFSRRQMLKPEIFDLNKLILEMEKMIRRLIGENIELMTATAPEKALIRADISQIEQVIMNLVVNANDAMPTGGKLVISSKNTILKKKKVYQYGEIDPGEYIMLSVSDNGTGIKENILNNIFEPFFTTKDKNQGTGLGLATVYGIVIQSNGYIGVETQLGKGSTFEIYFSKVSQGTETPAIEHVVDESFKGTETILVIEDEESVRSLVCEILRLHGYRVLEARQGEDALLICKQQNNPIDLMLSDVIMPGMSGKELAIRLNSLQPQMKVLLMSGYDSGILHSQVEINEDVHFLQKPFKSKVLLKTIRKLLDEKAKNT